MKKLILFLILIVFATIGYAQENAITISGGYAFANIEDNDNNGTGWRINALYEYNPGGGNWAHGFSLGYVSIKAEGNNVKSESGSWPIYYAPKYMFGSEKVKGFIKGAIGYQISKLERTAVLIIEDNDAGFVGGGGVGIAYNINEKVFLSAEYELLWMSNSFYVDGLLNTASLGIGFKF
jgi:hypothetical protein